MLNSVDFSKCIKTNLKDKGFHHKRVAEIAEEYENLAARYETEGVDATTAAIMAQRDTFKNMADAAAERAKRQAKALSVQAEDIARVKAGADVRTSKLVMDGKKHSAGTAAARAAVAKVSADPRFPGISYDAAKDTTAKRLYSLFGATLSTIGRGAFGRQKGKAHLPNVIREIKGDDTGDVLAKEFADAWRAIQDVAVDMFNAAGGSMKKLDNYLPQGQSAVKVLNAGKDRWIKVHADALDWDKTRHPDGSLITPEERQDVLSHIFDTITSEGTNKIDPTKFRGQGRAVGNAIDQHRFMHYKGADAWLKVQEEFSDTNIFEVLTGHIDDMAHRIALVDTFGPNPEMAVKNLNSIVLAEASKHGPKAVADAKAVLKSKLEPMYEIITRQNPVDPHSVTGALVTGSSNIITSAVLGSATFMATVGDFAQTMAVRSLNKQRLFGGMSTYFKAIATDQKFQRDISTQSGFVMDEVVMSTYAQTRFTGVTTLGPAATRHISEATMRLSLLSPHTRAARWAVTSEFMGLLNRMRDTGFEELPFKHVLRRYGIDATEWDALRNNVGTWSPRRDVKFLRPIDILETKAANANEIFRKFQGMLHTEAKYMVPDSTTEAAVSLRGTTRPDTLIGTILHSFSMYKNFPMSFVMIYGRLGMTAETKAGRLGFFAGLGAAMTLAGAMGVQMREVSRGRDPLPMDNAAFMGKAFLSGGALAIWGDFLFTGVNEYGRDPSGIVAGPLAGALGDVTGLAFGDVFQFADKLGSLSDDEFKSTTASKAVEFGRRYTPGSTIWWARTALERQVWDRLQLLADPKAYKKQNAKARRQETKFGNKYWWKPGDATPDRTPSLGE